MKRWIHASDEVMKQSIADDEYYSTTPRNEVEFDHDVVWSVQFYPAGAFLLYDKEVFVLGKTYKEARDQGVVLAEAWGYPTDPSHCVVQYAYVSINRWSRFNKDECDGVEFGID